MAISALDASARARQVNARVAGAFGLVYRVAKRSVVFLDRRVCCTQLHTPPRDSASTWRPKSRQHADDKRRMTWSCRHGSIHWTALEQHAPCQCLPRGPTYFGSEPLAAHAADFHASSKQASIRSHFQEKMSSIMTGAAKM